MHSVFGVEDDNGYLFAKRSLAKLGQSSGLPNITPANPDECGGGTNKRPLSHEKEKVK